MYALVILSLLPFHDLQDDNAYLNGMPLNLTESYKPRYNNAM